MADYNSSLLNNITSAISSHHALCRDVHQLPATERCAFIGDTHDCEMEGFIDYASFIYCGFDADNDGVGIAICIFWTIILFVALGVAATDFLCPALFVMSQSLNMSQNVAGVTLIAFGNGSPDVFAAIAGMRQGRPTLVVSGLLGGGTFVTMGVVGSIFSLGTFRLLPMPFVRDIAFYLVAATWTFYLFIVPKAIDLYDGIGFILFYVFYVALVVLSRYWDKTPQAPLTNPHLASSGDDNEEHTIEFEGIQPDCDLTEEIVVMKGFVFLTEEGKRRRASKKRTEKTKSSKTSILKVAQPEEYVTPIKDDEDSNIIPSLNIYRKNRPSIVPTIKVNGMDNEGLDVDNDTFNENIGYNNNLTVTSYAGDLSQFTVTSLGKVSVMEDNYNTVNSTYAEFSRTYGTNRTKRSSVFSISKQSLQQVRRQSKEFFEKVSPIDFHGWKQKDWGGRGFEIIKAPIRFFLLLTTPMAEVEGKSEWNKPLSVLHCITGPLFALFALGYGFEWIAGTVPLAAVVFVVAAIIAFAMIFTSHYETAPSYYKTYSSILGFVIGVVWVFMISNEAVSVMRTMGLAFDISEPAIGLTVLAWGNCLLDFISNISIARQGLPKMAVAASLGSPLLALLIGVGIPATLMLAMDPGSVIQLESSEMIVVVYTVLAFGLILTVVIAVVFKFVAQVSYGWFLIIAYLTLMVTVALMEAKVINIVLF
ncbi:putative sodium/calcium exchanger 7 [Halotydeus destructor]|nr:putative sodium/calcium exchanger 7 [Halotydeus destructor]